jgi:hypothetical protein
MFTVVRERALSFFDIEAKVVLGNLNRCEAIASTLLAVWLEVSLLTCWPHLVRQTRSKKTLLRYREKYDIMIKPQLLLLFVVRSHAQLVKMSDVITEHCIASNKRIYAKVVSLRLPRSDMGPLEYQR